MNVIEMFICIILLVTLIYGIYLIVNWVIYYKSAEEREATVVDSQVLPGDNYGRVYYNLMVDIEDSGEIFTVPAEGRLRLKYIEHALKNGDKITVWYLKKYKRCVNDRCSLIKGGVYFIVMVIATVGISVFSLFFVNY